MESGCVRTAATVVVQMIQGGKHRLLTAHVPCAGAIARHSLEWSLLVEWLENKRLDAQQSKSMAAVEKTGMRNVGQ